MHLGGSGVHHGAIHLSGSGARKWEEPCTSVGVGCTMAGGAIHLGGSGGRKWEEPCISVGVGCTQLIHFFIAWIPREEARSSWSEDGGGEGGSTPGGVHRPPCPGVASHSKPVTCTNSSRGTTNERRACLAREMWTSWLRLAATSHYTSTTASWRRWRWKWWW